MTTVSILHRFFFYKSSLKCRWLFLAIVLVSVSAWSYGPSPGPAKSGGKPKADSAQYDDNSKTTDKIGTKDFHDFVEISKTPVIQIESSEEKKDIDGYFSSEWWLVYVTVLLSLITLGLAIYTAKLYRATVALGNDAKITSERQAGEMKESLEIANAAAQAAISGNELNRKSFVSSQRPWVVVKNITPSSALDLKSGLSFTFVIKNVGNSPGMNVDVGAVMHLPHRGDAHLVHGSLRESQAAERKKRAEIEGISFGYLLAPGEEIEIKVRSTNDPIEYQKAAAEHPSGEVIILILGQVSYFFGIDESWHESGFMFSVRRHGGVNVRLVDDAIPIEEVEIERFPAGFYAT